MLECGFGKIALRGLFDAAWPFGTELYARILYLREGETEALLVAMDSLDTFPREASRFCEIVSAQSGIPADNIWYHELQLHAAPTSMLLQGESMRKIASEVAKEAVSLRENAVSCRCKVAEADFGTRFSFNREQYVHGLGGVTIWAGMEFDDLGRAHTENPQLMLLRGYEPELPVFSEPIYFDNNVDPKAYLFVFEDMRGNVVGTLSRFAAHPDIGVLFESILFDHTDLESKYHYDYDWPGTVSSILEEKFGAPSMYVNGPCADLATKKRTHGNDTYEKAAAEARRIGAEIAEALWAQYVKKTVSMQSDKLRLMRFKMDLPMRENFPETMRELEEGFSERLDRAERAMQSAIAAGESPATIKKLIDDRWRVQQEYGFFHEVCGFGEENLRSRTVEVAVSALQLGDYLFVGVPGESLSDMGEWLRSTFTGAKTVPVDQVGGYYNYMATPASLTKGGYTYWSSWVRRDAVPMLKRAVWKKLSAWLAEN